MIKLKSLSKSKSKPTDHLKLSKLGGFALRLAQGLSLQNPELVEGSKRRETHIL